MSSRFDLLKKQGARAGDRHATLAAAIDASFQTLSREEQSALGQCAVFRGGFTLEAAEAVVDLSAFGAPPVIDVLQGLRQRSLLRAAEASGVPGEVRLAMFAGVRAYAIDKLSAEERAAACERHAHHVVRAAEEHEKHLAGKDGPEHRARILAERDNLLEVIDRVLGRGPVSSRTAEPALRALLVLSNVAPETGPLETFVRALDPVLTATKDSGADPRLSARALHARGVLLLSRGDVRGGSRDLVQALAVARTLGDAALEARATAALGGALASRGDRAAAREHLQRAADAFHRLGDAGSAATATASLAELTHREGRAAEGEALAERALSIHRAQKDLLGEASDRLLLGRFAADRGDLSAARAHLAQSAALAREAESRKVEALATGWLGLVAQLDPAGESPSDRAPHGVAGGPSSGAARDLFEAAASALGAMGLVPAEALFTGLLGVALREGGAPAEAFARLGAATERIASGGDDAHLALFLVHLAALDADIGRAAEAAATLARAEKLLERAPEPAILAIAGLVRARLDPPRAPRSPRRGPRARALLRVRPRRARVLGRRVRERGAAASAPGRRAPRRPGGPLVPRPARRQGPPRSTAAAREDARSPRGGARVAARRRPRLGGPPRRGVAGRARAPGSRRPPRARRRIDAAQARPPRPPPHDRGRLPPRARRPRDPRRLRAILRASWNFRSVSRGHVHAGQTGARHV